MSIHNLSQSQLDDLFQEVEEIERLSLDIDDDDVIWKPHPGSQEFFLACPAYECLLSGPRGTGKTDVLLMDFARDCGVGWGANWKGLLLRQTYKQLADVIVKSRKWFPRIFPGIEFNKADLVWTWPAGETLMLSYMDSPSHYDTYHGWEIPWCVSHDTKVRMADGSTKMIRDIHVGDQVMTLEGPKPVLRVIHSFKPAVEASFFDDDDQLLGTQIQGEEHQILSIYGMHTGCSQDSLNEALQSSQTQDPWLGYKSLQDARQHNSQVFLTEQNQESPLESNLPFATNEYYDKLSSYLCQIFLQSLKCQSPCKKNKQDYNLFLKNVENFFSHISDHISLPKEVRGRILKDWRFLLCGIQSFLARLLPLRQKMEGVALDCESSYVQDVSQAQDSILNHFSCSGHNDAQSHLDQESVQDNAPLLVENAIPILTIRDKDVLGQIHKHGLSNFYTHPYSGELRRSTLSLHSTQVSSCKFSPLNKKVHLVDLTIADASHYITDLNQSQVVSLKYKNNPKSIANMNCSFEELTNWPTDECYELMKTLNRSSFRRKVNGEWQSVPKRIRATTNPWGKGHAWIKKYFINAGAELEVVANKFGKTRTWINSKLLENTTLHNADPDYVNILKSIKDPNKRKAWLYGSWDIVSGGIIGDIWEHDKHVLKPFPIPKEWKIDRAYDHGSSSPFSVGWFAESDGSEVEIEPGKFKYFPKGSIILIHEWYGWSGEDNTGLYMNSTKIALEIMRIEKEYGILNAHKVAPGPADTQIFNTEEGESIATRMARIRSGRSIIPGIKWKRANKKPGSRIIGLDLFRTMIEESLNPYPDKPCFYVFNTCRDGFLRCVPSMPRDEKNPDDADSSVEDHTYDMVRYRILSKIQVSKTQEV